MGLRRWPVGLRCAVGAALLVLVGLGSSAEGRQSSKRLEFGPAAVEWELIAASGKQGYGVALMRVEVAPEIGELPVELRLRSGSMVDVVLNQWRGRATTSEPAEIRLLVPMFALVRGQLRGQLRTPIFDREFDFALPTFSESGSTRSGWGGRVVGLFHVSTSAAPASQLVGFVEQLSGETLPPFEPFHAPAPFASGDARKWHGVDAVRPAAPPPVHFGSGYVHFRTPATASSPAGGPGATSSAYEVASLETHRLPRRALELTSAGGVLVDSDLPLPDGARLAVLLEYARLGGVLFFGGVSKADLVARAPVLAPLVEDRLRQARFGGGEWDTNTVDVYSLGLGRLVVGERRALGHPRTPDDPTRAALWYAFEREPNWLVDGAGDWAPLLPRTELDLGAVLPPGLLAVLCLALGVVIGPINYLVVWKRRRPALLLFTVPALSLTLALAIAVVGILRLGFDIQTTGGSLAVLDQRSGDLAVGEARGFFAGFTLEAGLAPEPGSIVFPFLPWRGFQKGPDFTVERDGALLTGEVLPSRRHARSMVLSARRTRQRLDVEYSSGPPKVSNGFDAPIIELVLRASDGSLYRAANSLAPGASAVLEPTDEAEVGRVLALLQPGPGFLLTSSLAPATYAAQLGKPTLVADLGVPLQWASAAAARHGVLGILEVAR